MQSTYRYESSFYQNVKSSVNKLDAVNKAYVDSINCNTATGIIPNSAATHHTLFTFPVVKDFSSGNIIVCDIWVERMAHDWSATLSPMIVTAWPRFHKFSRGLTRIAFFGSSPPVVGLAIFASTI